MGKELKFSFQANNTRTEVTMFHKGVPVYVGGINPKMDATEYKEACEAHAQNYRDRILKR